jgi:ubiquinone/menaquinone biosynthesis C-methylase UbiE
MRPLPKSPFPPYFALFLDNPIRRLLIDRERFLRSMGIKKGDRVLEIGCGPGFFTTVLSSIVGDRGRVYAQDVEEAMVKKVKKKLVRLGCQNVRLLLCNSSSLKLPDDSCDVVFCANVFEEIYKEGELEGTIIEIDRVLKDNGILVIKEHRIGGTLSIIKEIEARFISLAYKEVLNDKTFLSYHMKLLKSDRK